MYKAFTYFLFLILPAILLSCAEKEQEPQARPNILFIMSDDHAYQAISAYSDRLIRTPNIDRLAGEGLRFTQHYSGSTVCAPSRCVLMTGLHTGHAWIRANGGSTGTYLRSISGRGTTRLRLDLQPLAMSVFPGTISLIWPTASI